MENNEVENNSGERRFARRHETKDVLVYIRYFKQINWLHRFTGPFTLDDIAISSIRFQCPKNFLAKSQVEIKLASQNLNSELILKGRIIGKKGDLFENRYEYIVQFNPFGKGLTYNSFECKELLELFIASIEADEEEL
jgi:hypothetical protein